jgi:hypothetical protein
MLETERSVAALDTGAADYESRVRGLSLKLAAIKQRACECPRCGRIVWFREGPTRPTIYWWTRTEGGAPQCFSSSRGRQPQALPDRARRREARGPLGPHRHPRPGKTSEFATEAEAQAEYEAQVRKRRERGYRQVRDASAPRDAEAARKRRSARPARSRRARASCSSTAGAARFVWLEASGSEPLTAEGPVGAEAEAEPRSEPCGSPAAASRRRDTAMAKLMASGFELATFAAAEVRPVRRAPSKKDFARDPGLEAHLAEAPGDAARWEVYEDWPLEQGDPRTALIEAERGGSRGDAAQERGRLLGRLRAPSPSA